MGRSRNVSGKSLTITRARCLVFRRKMIRAVRRWLARLGVLARDVADVAQEVMLAAQRRFHSYDPGRARPERWLNRIAVHAAAHYNDRAFHRREVLTARPGIETPDPGPDPHELVSGAEMRALLLDCLERMDADLRTVLVAHDLDGIPMREIAGSLGVPTSTLYKRHARARRVLWELLFERMPPGPDDPEGHGENEPSGADYH